MTNETKKPYVGVSGVVSPEMQLSLEVFAAETGLYETNRVLALGVKAVHKTQFLDIENKYGQEWYPVGEESFKLSLRHDSLNPNTTAVAQAYLDVDYVDDENYRNSFLQQIVNRGKPWLHAIQFDMLPWHSNVDMWSFLETVKEQGIDIFLQAHKPAMETLGPKETIRTLGKYASLIDYVLFDSSHGTGKRLDTNSLEPFIAEAYANLDTSQTGVAVAGGLNANIVREDLPMLVEKYPEISWDAEGQLHPINDAGRRPLNIEVARDYLRASVDVLMAK